MCTDLVGLRRKGSHLGFFWWWWGVEVFRGIWGGKEANESVSCGFGRFMMFGIDIYSEVNTQISKLIILKKGFSVLLFG